MKVLVIGSGGREHALVWKLRQSPRVSEIYCAPGNGGIADEATCLAADVKKVESLVALANQIGPDLTVVGPEVPLQLGVVDEFTKRGWRVFGPTRAAAQLESSKSFAKEFMQRHRIPTAHYAICNSVDDIHKALPHFHTPLVVKADGLAAGKGVVICKSKEETITVASEMLSGKMLGEAGTRVVVEECLQGEELSFLVVSDGERVAPLVPAQDHKRVGDGDTGPNTGGMGAYAPAPAATPALQLTVIRDVLQPIVHALSRLGSPFTGVLYAGLMVVRGTPYVLEFNARFGDPETQVVLPLLKTDLIDLMEAAIAHRLDQVTLEWHEQAAVCVVLTSAGYPGDYAMGAPIRGLSQAPSSEDTLVFHAGTKRQGNDVVTAGGRVLGVTGLGPSLMVARERAYRVARAIAFDGCHLRSDIATRALQSVS